ncbi:hypothetical protein JCGZ_05975 [Jatropha curcas]|uniref:Uncharacterized protein n=1 Tax=Jatropha curcas TaxID=180498 RepID=A0A067KMR8_JATCU|nr:hypothetical protein JCGZ_05975 [Jatropha curcas]
MTDFDEQLIKSPEPSFEQLVKGTQFMVGMVQAGSGTEWSQEILEFKDFLGIGDEASKMVEPNLNQIFFVPEASGEFQSRGKTYPGLEIFMTDFDEQLIKSPEPSFEQLVKGTQFMVGMVQAGSGTEWSQEILEFKDFLGIGDEASKMV